MNDLYMPPDGGYLRIATYGRGLWQLSNLDYIGAAFTDDGNSCDHNGNIGNNETGHLTLTFSNPTASPVAGGSVTVASDNPHLTFTGGSNVALGTVDANGTASALFLVKVQGATGVETANLTIAYGDSAIATIKRPITINYDDNANASATTVNWESQYTGWTISNLTSPKPGDNFVWERRELSPVLHTMAVTDANAVQDTSLVSPVLHVGAGNFSFSFNHRFVFENKYDGGIAEISTDNGTTWTQITGIFTAGAYSAVLSASDGPFNGQLAWTGTSTAWPAYMNSAVDLGTTYANQNVRIRFHAGADSGTGGQGWEISDVSFVGLTNSPFGSVVTHNEVCGGLSISVVSAANPSNSADQVTFSATITGGVTPATGVVTFKEGATVIGSVAAIDSIATITTSTLAVGTHYIVASFAGDAGHTAIDSAAYKHTVLPVSRTTMTPVTLDFGDVHTGQTSVLTSVLKNAGTAPLLITGFTTTTGDFTATNNCSTSIAANGTCTVTVTFKPVSAQGTRTGTVTMAGNGVSGDIAIALTGNSTRAFASMSKPAVSYANTLVGSTTAAQIVTVTNSGNLPLNITAVGISGDYAQTNTCTTAAIAPAASCTVSATFSPTATGNRAGTVTLTSDADNTSQTIALSGKGEHLQISGTTSQTVSVQTKASYPLTLKASTGLAGVVTLTCSGAPALTTCAFDNAAPTITAGGTAAVTVTVNPAPTTASAAPVGQTFFAAFGLLGLLLLPLTRKASGRKALSMVLLAVVIMVSVGGMVACGSSSSAPVVAKTPVTTFATPGTYTLTVSASNGGTVLQTQTLTLTLQ